MKDDVDLILNALCKPDTFTASKKVRLGILSPFQWLLPLIAAPASLASGICHVLPTCFAHLALFQYSHMLRYSETAV